MTRNGKIAHLPFHLREELNVRLCNGEPGNKLVDWLNSHAEAIAAMKTYFHGRPITEQNMSEWRNGGYEQWASLRVILGETTGLSEGAAQIAENGLDTSEMLLVITANYAAMIQRWNLTPVEDLERMMSIFKNLTNAVLTIRRSEQRDALIEIQRERLELLREKQSRQSASTSSSPASSSQDDALSPKDSTLSSKDDTLSSKDSNLSPKDSTLPSKDSNLSSKDSTLPPKDDTSPSKPAPAHSPHQQASKCPPDPANPQTPGALPAPASPPRAASNSDGRDGSPSRPTARAPLHDAIPRHPNPAFGK